MDKKQFFESFISPLSDNSGHRLDSFGKIQAIFDSVKSNLSDKNLRNEFEKIEKEILFHVWMFEQICNGEVPNNGNGEMVLGPLIVISVSGEILFVNKAYCQSSGLSPTEIQSHEHKGTLYGQVYEGEDINQAREATSRLHAGKGYKRLELLMKYSGRKISWNSYGGVGAYLEIRSGREISDKNNQEKERNRYYRGSIMNSIRLLDNLFQISINEDFSEENEQYFIWIGEFLSMFDFLWNHSELFMEIINVPTIETGGISGSYNTVYAQFLKHSFEERKKFKEILTTAHEGDILDLLSKRETITFMEEERRFCEYNRCPVALIHWHHSVYPHEMVSGYDQIFSMGILVHKIPKKNIFTRIYRYFFKDGKSHN